jgi:ribosome maturation factor RimP
MSQSDPLRQRLVAIVEPACHAAGYDLVDLRLKSEPGGWVLRIYIDVLTDEPDPEWWKHGVDLADCERLSRELSAVLDVDDPIPHTYNLEISSPGIDRPLRTAAHFRRFAGAEVKVTLAVPLAGTDRKNWKGTLRGVSDAGDAIVVELADLGHTFHLPIDDIETAKLVPDWDEVMRGGSGVGPHPPSPAKPRGKAAHR